MRCTCYQYNHFGKAPIRFLNNDILNEITEIRTSCGFRKNMIQVANRPCDEVALEWAICWHLESLIQDVIEISKPVDFDGFKRSEEQYGKRKQIKKCICN